MLLHSTKIVSNLQESKGRLTGIKSDLESGNLVTDSEHLESIFRTVKSNLIETVNFMSRIASFKPSELKNNGEQVAEVQLLANQVQKSLVQARIEMDKLGESTVIPNTEKTLQDLNQLYMNFVALTDIYSTQIQDSHLTFERLDEPDTSLLPKALESGHRSLVISAIARFADTKAGTSSTANNPLLVLVEQFITGKNPNVNKELAIEIFSPLLISLSGQLIDQRDLIYQDCDKLMSRQNDVEYSAEQYPYLESLINSINEILPNGTKLISSDDVVSAIKDDAAYSNLITRLRETALSSKDIKPSEFAKTILTLQALKIKHHNQAHPDLQVDLESMQVARALEKNDATDPIKFLVLFDINLRVQKYLKELDMLDSNERFLSSCQTILLTDDAKAITKDADLAISIYRLKKEFNSSGGLEKALENPDSEISQLLKKYKSIFIKSNIDGERLAKLDAQNDNSDLRLMLEDIFKAAKTYNSIDQHSAAELIHILGQGLGIDMTIKNEITRVLQSQ